MDKKVKYRKHKNKCEIFDWTDKEYIISRVQEEPQLDENKILKYLKSGNVFSGGLGIIHDVFDKDFDKYQEAYDAIFVLEKDGVYKEESKKYYKICEEIKIEKYTLGPNNFTDGEWCWDSVLIYYIENYHFRISDEFCLHIETKNWNCPQLSIKEIEKFCKRY
ncbi:MAG: hypothetical protein FWE13_01470 [Firmicutes bacterium]|nr:hypothetical protein [Bacillota bacterium]